MVGGLRELAASAADSLHVSDGATSYSRGRLNELANRTIDALRRRGVGVGDPVAILAGNRADWAVLVSATSLGGMPPVPVNTHLTLDETAYILANAQARTLFVDRAHAGLGREAAAVAGLAPGQVVDIDEPSWADELAAASPAEPPDDTPFAGTIYYTSGTTGRPKGTRMNMVPTGVPVDRYLDGVGPLWELMEIGPHTRHLVTGPLYHAAPQTMFASCLDAGATVHVMPRFEPEEALRLVEAHRIDTLIVVPTMLVRWLRLPDEVRDRHDVTSLRAVTHTAAPCPPEVKRAIIDRWGPVLREGYGASEIGALTSISAEEWLERPGSVGRPLPMFALRIVDDDGADVSPGEVGRVFAQGLQGHDISYIGEPEKTAAAHLDGGWFTLGDLGWLDDEGYLFLVDRRVDVIITGGVNVYPAEVEAALLAHPAVADVGVFGIPDPEWGQQVKAAVELRPGHVPSAELAAEILAWLREYRLARFKVPRSIDFHERLPRADNGKLYKRALRDPYWVTPPGPVPPAGS